MVRAAAAACFALLAFPAVAPADPTITFKAITYSPSVVRIAPGQAVTWTGAPGNTFAPLTGHPLTFADPAIAGQSDTSNSTKRTFATIGRVTFACALHGSFGMTGTVVVTANHLPAPALSAPSSAAAGTAVAFDASGSSDPDAGQTLTYSWDFDGNGIADQTGPSPMASFTYSRPGAYTAELTATDDNAEPGVGPESASTTRQITVVAAGQASGGPGGGGAGGSNGSPGGGNQGPQQAARPGQAIAVAVSAVSARGLTVQVSAPHSGRRATATLKVGSRVIGRAASTVRAGSRKLRIALNRRGRSLLAHRSRVRARLEVVVVDAAGHAVRAVRVVTLRR